MRVILVNWGIRARHNADVNHTLDTGMHKERGKKTQRKFQADRFNSAALTA